MQKYVDIITRMFGQVYPHGLYLYYTAAAIFFLLVKRRKKDEERLLGIYSMIMFALILLPFFTMLVWRFLRNGGVYWRLMWMIPYSILIGYAGTELITGRKNPVLRILTAGLICAAVILGGSRVYTKDVFQVPTSREKLPQITLTTMSVINENAERTGNPYKRLCAPVDILCQIRQVDATILQWGERKLQYEKLDESTPTGYYYKVMNGMIPDSKRRIAKFMRSNEMNYIVFPKKYKFMRTLHLAQCVKLYDKDGWQIWYHPYINNTKHANDYETQ